MDSIKVTNHHQYTIQNTIIELLQHFINYLVKFSTAAKHASNHTLNKAKFACMFYRLSGYVIPITNMVKKHISSQCFVNLMISTPLLCIQSGTLSCVPRYKTHATYCCTSEIQSFIII